MVKLTECRQGGIDRLKMVEDRQIPKYSITEFAPKKHEYAVLIFIINEVDKIFLQLERMMESGVENCVDIILADGGSTDGSNDKQRLSAAGVNTLLVKEDAGKLGSQMRMGFDFALRRGYKGTVVIDGNNKDSVGNIKDFVRKLAEGYDHVQGSRFIPGGYHENTPLSRLLGLKIIHAPLLSLFSGVRYTDTTNGFRAYSARLLNNPEIAVFRDIFTHYELHYYLALQAGKQKLRCCEIPVSRKYPASGKVPTKISPIKGNLSVLKKLFMVVLGFYNLKD